MPLREANRWLRSTMSASRAPRRARRQYPPDSGRGARIVGEEESGWRALLRFVARSRTVAQHRQGERQRGDREHRVGLPGSSAQAPTYAARRGC
jgi:hypothetical protein